MSKIIRIAAIDPHTGYVWGVSENTPDTPNAVRVAASQIMTNADGSREYPQQWFAECPQADTRATLHLYEIADDVEVHDGQDAGTIARVELGKYLGSLRYTPED